MFHAFEGAAHRLRLVTHAGRTVARIAADGRQPVDLHTQFVQRLLDGTGRLRGLQRKRADLGGDDRKTLARITGARRLDRGIQRQQVGLAGDGADLLGDIVDIGKRLEKPAISVPISLEDWTMWPISTTEPVRRSADSFSM